MFNINVICNLLMRIKFYRVSTGSIVLKRSAHVREVTSSNLHKKPAECIFPLMNCDVKPLLTGLIDKFFLDKRT